MQSNSFSPGSSSGSSRFRTPSTGGRSGGYGQRSGGSSYQGSRSGGGSSHSSSRFSRGGSSGGGYRGGGGGGYRAGRSGGFSRGGGGQRIDISKFVNKAVTVEEVGHFVPEHMFTDFPLDERLKTNVVSKGYKAPTPIQDRAIPYILKGSDIVGIANTGTGKTAAFLIPLIQKMLVQPREKIIIMVPTRELAIQIDVELRAFTKNLNMYSVCCVGGAPIYRQISQLKLSHTFVIGTPGRLKDLVERKYIHLPAFKTVVLDEADRMLDMGFIHDMRYMMSHMPKDRHTLFFSATLSKEIERLIGEFLREPVTVSVKTQDTSKHVDQDIIRVVQGTTKIDVLNNLLLQPDFGRVLIFGKTKHGVEKLSATLVKRGIKSESIHGNKSHGQRQRALQDFKDGRVQVLVATDVAARGLDINDVTHVINYDIPATYEDYVHRIGRTGRGGKKGKALTFIE